MKEYKEKVKEPEEVVGEKEEKKIKRSSITREERSKRTGKSKEAKVSRKRNRN